MILIYFMVNMVIVEFVVFLNYYEMFFSNYNVIFLLDLELRYIFFFLFMVNSFLLWYVNKLRCILCFFCY